MKVSTTLENAPKLNQNLNEMNYNLNQNQH